MKDFLWLHLRDLPYFRALVRAVEAAFYQGLALPAPTLDLGCGDGHFASLAFNHRLDAGLDPWADPLRQSARRRVYRWLVQAEGAGMPFRDGSFASAISNSVLEHIPNVEAVLAEAGRVLLPGAPFVFCVPNPAYFSALSLTRLFGRGYADWFRRISRVCHADPPEVWRGRLEAVGFHLERCWNYFPPQAMRVLEWGHYLGLPSLIVRKVTGRWILAPTRWNLGLTEQLLRKHAHPRPAVDGTFTFYVARKQ